MPKSNFLRKKSKGGSSDFKRIKAKVGKKALKPASHTDTSFKSKRVFITAQSILSDLGDSNAVTARGQSVQELLVQLRHYSPSSKCEALAGLKSVVEKYPGFAEANFARIAEPSLELAVCVEDEVRSSLLSYQGSLLGHITTPTFTPFADLYMAYVVSAMTSLHKAVRRDSLALLALLLAHFPAIVAVRADRLAPNYAVLLAADPSSKKQVGRAKALKSLVELLRAVAGATCSGSMTTPTQGDPTVPPTRAALTPEAVVNLNFRQGSHRNGVLLLRQTGHKLVPEGGGGWGMSRGNSSRSIGQAEEALGAALPLLLEKVREVWMEAIVSEPLDFGLLQCVVDVLLQVVRNPSWMATWPILTVDRHSNIGNPGGKFSSSEGIILWLSQFVPLVLEVFPLRPMEGELQDKGKEEQLQQLESLNMGLCGLVVASTRCVAASRREGGSGGVEADGWLTPVLDHIHRILREGTEGSEGGGVMREVELRRQVPSILRVLVVAMKNVVGVGAGVEQGGWLLQRQCLLSAFGDFCMSLAPSGDPRQMCVGFICKLSREMLTASGSSGAWAGKIGGGSSDPEAIKEVCRWLKTLPGLLLTWGGRFPALSVEVIRVLLEVAKRAPTRADAEGSVGFGEGQGNSEHSKADSCLGKEGSEARTGNVLTGGIQGSGSEAGVDGAGGSSMREVWVSEAAGVLISTQQVVAEIFEKGMFLTLPPAGQLDLVSLVYHLPSIPRTVIIGLGAACTEPLALRDDIRNYILEVMHHRRQSMSTSAYLGFLVSVLTGNAGRRGRGGSVGVSKNAVVAAGGSPGDDNSSSPRVGGKRKRIDAGEKADTVEAEESAGPSPLPTWDRKVLERESITSAVCRSLRMLCTRRSSALLEALQPVLLQLLMRDSGTKVGGCREKELAPLLRRQRTAMACLLSCHSSVMDSGLPSSPVEDALLEPLADACILIMRAVGGRMGAGVVSWGGGAPKGDIGQVLLHPVLALLHAWPTLFRATLDRIVTASATSDSSGSVCEEVVTGSREVEPLLKCLKGLLHSPLLQDKLRKTHGAYLPGVAVSLCQSLGESPIKPLVLEVAADIALLVEPTSTP